jgi:hypothetical protein
MTKGNGKGFRVLSVEEMEHLTPKERQEYYRDLVKALGQINAVFRKRIAAMKKKK